MRAGKPGESFGGGPAPVPQCPGAGASFPLVNILPDDDRIWDGEKG